eukprot:TRINITY_DN4163_c0_g1_i5.p1 TRINITY_DN4163_c0_g1~~TRINITY_DN4163_c0_g1_i5.p1  ORF type:complete len:179 (+),score=31.29 TRINITY_DN4163_c0_g1_i5:482-1018(+)
MGIYLLGGQISKFEYNRSIWQITSDSKSWSKFAQPNKGQVDYIVNVEKLKIEGPEPTPRALQTAVFYNIYIIVFGGRNSGNSVMDGYCFNDLLILNLNTLTWQPLAVYGFAPTQRWGHVMAVDKESVLIFGGISEGQFANATIYTAELNKKVVKENIEECRNMKSILESEGSHIKSLL